MAQSKHVITITFSEQVENHAGNQMIGKLGLEGIKLDEIENTKNIFEKLGFKTEFLDLVKEGEVEDISPTPQPAGVLIIREGYKAFLGDDFNISDLNKEILNDDWDKKCWMRGRVVNKKARWNLCYADEEQEPKYEEKKGRIIPFRDVPNLSKVKDKLGDFFGEKAKNLYAEGFQTV